MFVLFWEYFRHLRYGGPFFSLVYFCVAYVYHSTKCEFYFVYQIIFMKVTFAGKKKIDFRGRIAITCSIYEV